jgi:RNA polymerase sigma-70 factor (sigma-E family)
MAGRCVSTVVEDIEDVAVVDIVSRAEPDDGPEPTDETFAAFFATEYAPMVRLALLLVDDLATAEEITQDAFVQLHRRWASGNIDNPSGYLRRCVANGGRDVQRRRGVRRRARLEIPESTEPAYRELDDALVRLPQRERTAVVLRYFDDLHETEIAEVLGVRPSTVRTLVRRGLNQLRREVER